MHLFGRSRQLPGKDPLLVFQVPRVGLSKVSLTLGPLDIFLHQRHSLLQLLILLGEGLHPLDQMPPLFGSSCYALQ